MCGAWTPSDGVMNSHLVMQVDKVIASMEAEIAELDESVLETVREQSR